MNLFSCSLAPGKVRFLGDIIPFFARKEELLPPIMCLSPGYLKWGNIPEIYRRFWTEK